PMRVSWLSARVCGYASTCVSARLDECMRADTWRSPSLAVHIVESSQPVWTVLYLSLFSLLFYPSIFCPPLSAFFPSVIFCSSPCPYCLLLLFRSSFTMLRDFY
ncbi:hypothetical protein CHARACLAT_020057, partial [Characodon lateralis]|nr:hypothetical protein [Characodon lateralis]